MIFQNSVLWRKAVDAACIAIKLSYQLPKEEMYGMRSQMSRAAVSISSNIAEGWTREYRREKIRFLSYAHGSLTELMTQCLICVEVGWLKKEELNELFSLLEECSRMLTALRKKYRLEPDGVVSFNGKRYDVPTLQ